MMRRRLLSLPLALALALPVTLLVAPATRLTAQEIDPLSRLDPQTRYQILLIMDSAQVRGMPTRPLQSKAFEGISKRAEPRRILAAVRALYHALDDARGALGPGLTEMEWSAAASALQAGVPANALARFRTDRAGKPLARALVVMADLITRGVPVDMASSAIFELWKRGAGDDDFYGLWRTVESDILSGANPGSALQQRAQQFPGPSGQVTPQRQPETESTSL